MPSRHGAGSVVTPLPAGKPLGRLTAAVAFAAACAWWIDLALLRGGTPHPLDDTWEYGLVARSLLAGHGFRTPMIHPPLWGLHDAALTVPVLVHGPLLSLLGAPALALLGPRSIDGAAWPAAGFAVLAAVFTARAVGRAAGTFSGAVAGALLTGSPILLRMVHHDLAPAAGACVVALLLDLVTRPRPHAFAVGVVTGAGVLVRPELLLTAPCAGIALGAAGLVPYALGVLLVVSPWAWHTWKAAGSPAFNLSSYLLIAYTPAHPGLAPLWDFAIPPSRWPAVLVQAMPSLPAKWLHFAPRAVKHMLMAPGPGLGFVSGLGLLVAARAPRTRRWALAALLAAMIPFVLGTTTESSERYVAVFLPLWVAGAVLWAGGQRRPRTARIALLVLMLPFTLHAVWTEAQQSAALRDWLAAERAALASRAAPELHARLLFADTPDFAAWTTGRPTIATTREAYLALPANTDSAHGVPSCGSALDEWFHGDVRALPAPTGGGAATR